MVTKLLASMSSRSKERKKNVLSFWMGPPSVPPNCFWLKGDFSRSIGSPNTFCFSNVSLAFSESSRKYMKALPW